MYLTCPPGKRSSSSFFTAIASAVIGGNLGACAAAALANARPTLHAIAAAAATSLSRGFIRLSGKPSAQHGLREQMLGHRQSIDGCQSQVAKPRKPGRARAEQACETVGDGLDRQHRLRPAP